MTRLQLVDIRTIDEAITLLGKYWIEHKPVEHYDARTIDEAVSLLDRDIEEAKIVAGGVDLLGLMKNKVMLP